LKVANLVNTSMMALALKRAMFTLTQEKSPSQGWLLLSVKKNCEEIKGQVSNKARLVTLVKSYEKEKEWANEKKKL